MGAVTKLDRGRGGGNEEDDGGGGGGFGVSELEEQELDFGGFLFWLPPTPAPESKSKGKGRSLKKLKKKHRRVPVPDEIHPGLLKYWQKRRQLFSKYDEGIKLDQESWYSVTPESIAAHIAKKCALFGPETVIVDAFCGCGGNTIQFAKICARVIAIDIDPIKIEYAKHNAEIYGVADRIQFICGDFMELAQSLEADVVFLSPPWGGPGYSFVRQFNLKSMIPMDGFKVFARAKEISQNIAYFLPRQLDRDQLDELADANGVKELEIEANIIRAATKANTVYFGDLVGRKAIPGAGVSPHKLEFSVNVEL